MQCKHFQNDTRHFNSAAGVEILGQDLFYILNIHTQILHVCTQKVSIFIYKVSSTAVPNTVCQMKRRVYSKGAAT